MGNYSSYQYGEVTIKNSRVFKEWLQEGADIYKKMIREEIKGVKIKNGTDFDGEFLDDLKIIGYWYSETLQFLKELAYFVDGEIFMECGEEDMNCIIKFNDNKCKITIGKMVYGKAEEVDKMAYTFASVKKGAVKYKKVTLKELDEKYRGKIVVEQL